MAKGTPALLLTADEAVLLMNAWRRLNALLALLDDSMRPDVAAAVRELAYAALLDLEGLIDRMGPQQLRESHRAPMSWHPDFRKSPWRRRGDT
jgi:hypothetical protein